MQVAKIETITFYSLRRLFFLTRLGADTTNVKLADARLLLSDTLQELMHSTGVDNRLTALGYKPEDIPALVRGTLPPQRVTQLAPAGGSWGRGTCKIV